VAAAAAIAATFVSRARVIAAASAATIARATARAIAPATAQAIARVTALTPAIAAIRWAIASRRLATRQLPRAVTRQLLSMCRWRTTYRRQPATTATHRPAPTRRTRRTRATSRRAAIRLAATRRATTLRAFLRRSTAAILRAMSSSRSNLLATRAK